MLKDRRSVWIYIYILAGVFILNLTFILYNYFSQKKFIDDIKVNTLSWSEIKINKPSFGVPKEIIYDDNKWSIFNNDCSKNLEDDTCFKDVIKMNDENKYVLYGSWAGDIILQPCPINRGTVCAFWVEKSKLNKTLLSQIFLIGQIVDLKANLSASTSDYNLIYRNNHFLLSWSQEEGLSRTPHPCKSPDHLKRLGVYNDKLIVLCSSKKLFQAR